MNIYDFAIPSGVFENTTVIPLEPSAPAKPFVTLPTHFYSSDDLTVIVDRITHALSDIEFEFVPQSAYFHGTFTHDFETTDFHIRIYDNAEPDAKYLVEFQSMFRDSSQRLFKTLALAVQNAVFGTNDTVCSMLAQGSSVEGTAMM